MVRRTRTFIKDNYAHQDSISGLKYLLMSDGEKSFFPKRIPKTLKYVTDDSKSNQYGILYSDKSVGAILTLSLPRYGLGNYIRKNGGLNPNEMESKVLKGLSRAGKRLIGVCRTNLFKRLESGGPAFILSLKRHILRNYIFLYTIENKLEIPIGAQLAEYFNEDDFSEQEDISYDTENEMLDVIKVDFTDDKSIKSYAKRVYDLYCQKHNSQFRWIRSQFFGDQLMKDLILDASILMRIISDCGEWNANNDPKILSLIELLIKKHPEEKVLVFSQFADTVKYIDAELRKRGITKLASVTGSTENPAEVAWQFSPKSNDKQSAVAFDKELRVLISTDVLSEGVNLQDCSLIVNFDLPWAIIRLVQRAGRIDRIGQKSDKIVCYSFLPAEGIERILHLRDRVRNRLRENAEVIGTDEAFFEDEQSEQPIIDIYNEKSEVLDNDSDAEVDLASQAYQIWKNAIDENPELATLIPNIPPVSYSARVGEKTIKNGVILYLSLGDGYDALAWVDEYGDSITQSQAKILDAAKCNKDTPALRRADNHHDLVEKGVKVILESGFSVGGQLGRTSGPRYRTYERIKSYIDENRKNLTLFQTEDYWKTLETALEEIYRFPLRESSSDTLKRQLRAGISDLDLSNLVTALSVDQMLCVKDQDQTNQELQIICSLGVRNKGK